MLYSSNYSEGSIPRGVFCECSSQKTRELRREIMQSMISVHREACNCEGTEQLPFLQLISPGYIPVPSESLHKVQRRLQHLLPYYWKVR